MKKINLNQLIKKKHVLSIIIIVIFIFFPLSITFCNYIYRTTDIILDNDNIDGFKDRTNILEYEISIPEINIRNIDNVKGESYSQVEFSKCGFLAEIGKPKIPFLTLKYLLPYGNDIINIDIKVGECITLEGSFNIKAAQEPKPIGSNSIAEYVIDKNLYSSFEKFPNMLYDVVGIYDFRGYRILIINIYPVKYIPNTGELSYFKTMNIQLELFQKNNVNSLFRGLGKDQERVLNIINNPDVILSYNTQRNQQNRIQPSYLNPDSYDYLIITNEALLNSEGVFTFQDLANSKEAAGYKTIIVTVEDIYANYTGVDNQERIRNFIIDAYQTWGIEYVLLGGDGDGGSTGESIIPARGLFATGGNYYDNNIPSDLYYAALNGTWNDDNDDVWGEPGEDDLFAELYIGRAPVDSEEELSNFINKTLFHESDSHSYLSKVLMVGEDLGWIPWGGDYMDEIINGSDAHGYTTVGFPDIYNIDTLYDRDSQLISGWVPSNISSLIEDDIHIISHMGHSSVSYNMKLNNDDVEALTNDHFFFLYSQGCYNGAFDNRGRGFDNYYSYDCIAENFVTTQHGAFAVIGNSRYGWGNYFTTDGSSQKYQRQFFDAIFGENICEIGRANQDSKHDNIGYINQGCMRWVYYELNLLGDPLATLHPQQNSNKPTITNLDLSPILKDQMTELNFSITYTDFDNNIPLSVNMIIDGNIYPMEKTNNIDIDYTDGCTYQLLIYLQPGAHNYSFECNDYKWKVSTSEFTDLIIEESPNNNIPKLIQGTINTNMGYKNITEFQYSVNYIDNDNNSPESINVIIDSIQYPLSKLDPYDSNYMDGCIYSYTTTLQNPGDYTFYFNCSDGYFTNRTDFQLGPQVESLKNYYMFLDHPYNWIDASDGEECNFKYDTKYGYYTNIDLPFNFSFYDKNFSSVYLGQNGYLSFMNPYPWGPPIENIKLPSDIEKNYYLITPFWTELNQNYNSQIYCKSTEDYWIAQWTDMYSEDWELTCSFQVILYKTGDIIFNFDYFNDISSYYVCGLNYGLSTSFYNSYQGIDNNTDDFSIFFTCKTLEHDLKVSVESSTKIPELNQNHIITATIENIGANNETFVELILFQNNNVINSTIIEELLIGEVREIKYNWYPLEKGHYNFTAYCRSVINESYINNNVYTKMHYILDTNLFDGLYMNYQVIQSDNSIDTEDYSYSQITGNIFHVRAYWEISGILYPLSWDVNVLNRIISNCKTNGIYDDGQKTHMWIFTNISIGDLITINIEWKDKVYKVVEESLYELEGFGNIEVIKLISLNNPYEYALYEKKTGILVEARYSLGDVNYHTQKIYSTNAPFYIIPELNIINYTDTYDEFGSKITKVFISIIDLEINFTWYTYNRSVPIYFSGEEGVNYVSLDNNTWSMLDDGPILITFYANDTAGNIISDDITIIKDTLRPELIINTPQTLDEFSKEPPSYEVLITEANLEHTWYTLNGSAPVYFIAINGLNSGAINLDIWDEFGNGPILITFYANDTAGNISTDFIIIHKYIKPKSNGIPGYNIFIIFSPFFIAIYLISVKFKRKNNF